MLKTIKDTRFWTGVPPWILIGAVAILLPIFTLLTVENINRQKMNTTRLLLEKGAALIRSFEAGTRTGMMGMAWGGPQLQKLLTETAQQPDIQYLMVADTNGIIRAHNNPSYIGRMHGRGLDLKRISRSETVMWRLLKISGEEKIFELFRKFSPTGRRSGMRRGHMGMRQWFELNLDIKENLPPHDLIIFVGLDMGAIEAARVSDTRHTIIMGVILLLVGFAGITLLLLAQSYRTTRASLSRIKAFSDNLVENMPIGLLAIDPDQKIASFNHVAGSILSLSPDTVMGKEAGKILPRDLWTQIEKLDTSKGVVEKEIECRVNNGKNIPLEIGATLLRDEAGIFLGHVLLFKDLSEVRSLRREVAKSQRLASVGMLAAGVAHEIRNPLSSIKGFATYFKERYPDVPENLHVANIMIQEIDRLNRVVGQLLELARPVSVSKKRMPVNPLVEDALKLAEPQMLEKQIRVQTRISPEVEAISVDPDKINQVLLNLYLNAIESMDVGGNLLVSISKNEEMKGIEIRISDSGIGIKAADLAHIFDPYYTTKASGTGLGLAIVHNIIEAHEGKITVESELGQGTIVIIFLPESLP
jgi:two-component system sensor histidine kinase HydH